MKYNIIVSDDVHAELELLVEWMEHHCKGRGTRFVEDYEGALKFLEKYPFCNPVKSQHYRIIQFEHFEYVLVYKIYQKDIVVARLVHSRSGFERMYG
jgi:hypothetical protein